MSWDIATARLYAGVPDASKDVALQLVMDAVLDAVQTVLGRELLLKRVKNRYYNVDTDKVRVPRYPIAQVIAINGQPPKSDVIVHHRVGWISFGTTTATIDDKGRHVFEVEYDGGYGTLPPALEQALWEIFLAKWGDVNQTTGGPTAGSGATVVQGSGEVSRVTLADFGSVSIDVGATVAGGGAAAGGADLSTWGWLAPWAWVLGTYRSESAPSVAFA